MFKKISIAALLLAGIALGARHAGAQSPTSAQKRSERKPLPFFFGTAPNLPVLGGGTVGQLTKWTGFNGSNSFIGDSIITETKLGQIGIGTTTPTSTLTVQGIIETLAGGLKFPDGTVQTTAGLNSIFHDGTLAGSGTSSSPLGISLGGVGTPQLAPRAVTTDKIAPGAVGTLQLGNGAVTGTKIAPLTVVRSLSGLSDDVSLLAGANIAINASPNALTISAPNSLATVAHDSTLTGDGTSASPLGVAGGNSITAFFAHNTIPQGFLDMTDPGADVVSKTVPAGSYAIFVHMPVTPIDNDEQDLVCTLSTGPSVRITVPGDRSAIMSLQDVATFTSPTNITVHCIGFHFFLIENEVATLTAIKVNAVQ